MSTDETGMAGMSDSFWSAPNGELGALVSRVAEVSGPHDESILFRIDVAPPTLWVRPLTQTQRRQKRVMDIAFSLTLMVLTAPILLAGMIAVRLSSRGPVFYSQVRTGLNQRNVGLDRRRRNHGPPMGLSERRALGYDRRRGREQGKPFPIYKLRTMTVDAERDGAQWAAKNDVRVTRIGRFLRRTRIDELPQLWNILRGDMSLVGPRPERPEFIARLQSEIPGYLHRLGCKPGLTGLAQVLGGYDTGLESVRTKVRHDLTYLQNWSVTNDLKIIARTVSVVLTGRGAH